MKNEGFRMKGNSSTHIPNDRYRDGWERIFGQNNGDSRKDKPVLGQAGENRHEKPESLELSKRLN
jgi:hypothetical protein